MPGVLSFGEISLRHHFVALVNKCRFALRPLSWTACFMIPAQTAGTSNILSKNPCFSLIQKSKSDYVKFALQVSPGVRSENLPFRFCQTRDLMDEARNDL